MAYGSVVTFRGLTFPWYFANNVNDSGTVIHVKKIHYPGTRGIQSLNMSRGELSYVHTGTIRGKTQASINSFISKISSVCDGAVGSLTYHGATSTSTFGESVEYGGQSKVYGTGGIAASVTSHYEKPFTITYTDKNTS